MKRGRQRQFAGPVIAFKLPAMLRLCIFAEAQEQNKSVSELIREILEKKFGDHTPGPAGPVRIPYEQCLTTDKRS